VIFIIVLIQQFKHKGALHGILGILTCGLYTFIWGWIRHSDLKLTKHMLVWTVCQIIPIVFAVAMPAVIMSIVGPTMMQQAQQQTAPAIRKPAATRKAKPPMPPADIDYMAATDKLWKNGRYTNSRQAVKFLSNALRLDPKSAVAHNNRGVAHCDMGAFKQAISDFDRAIQLNDGYVEAYNNRGRARYELNDFDGAVRDFTQAIALRGDYAHAFLNRGLAHYQSNRTANACSDFKKACELGDCDGEKWARSQKLCP
jgi:hypothetical protein